MEPSCGKSVPFVHGIGTLKANKNQKTMLNIKTKQFAHYLSHSPCSKLYPMLQGLVDVLMNADLQI